MRWKDYFSEETLKKGEKYSSQNMVSIVSISEENAYGDVTVRKTHRINLQLSEGKIRHISCTCKAADCAHMAAFLLKLDDIKPNYVPDIPNPFFLTEERTACLPGEEGLELKKYCGSSDNVILPEGIKIIGENAFINHDEIREVVLPKDVLTIGGHAFAGCSNLKTINIPSNLTDIRACAFDNCYELADENGIININGNVYKNDKHKTGTLEVTEGAIEIDRDAFMNNEFDAIILPSTLKIIGHDAFNQSSKLKEIVIPKSVEYICDKAFANCPNLEKVTFMGSNVKFLDLLDSDETVFEKSSKVKIICRKTLAEKLPARYLKFISEDKPAPEISNEGGKKSIVYARIDDFNVEQMMQDFAGIATVKELVLPKNCKNKIVINGKEFNVNCQIGSDLRGAGYAVTPMEYIDIDDAIVNLMTIEETQNLILRYSDTAEPPDIPGVDPNAPIISSECAERRYAFIFALGHYFSKDENLVKIAEAAPKKKDGTFNRAKIFRIASTGMVERRRYEKDGLTVLDNEILEIYSKAKDDTTLTVYAKKRPLSDTELGLVKEDYVSTHYEELGLDKYLSQLKNHN